MKKILAMLLVVMMLAAILSGCGGTSAAVEEEAKPAASSSSSSSAAAPAASEDEDEGEAEAKGDGSVWFEEPQEITFVLNVWADWEGRNEVFEEVSKIAQEKLNVKVNIKAITLSEFRTQVPLMLAAGEVIDLCSIPWSFATMTSQNMLLPLNDLLPEYAPYIMENASMYFPAMSVDGQIYGVPVIKTYNTTQYLIMRKDVLDYLGLYDEAMSLESWSALEAMLLKIKEAQDELPEELQTPVIFGQQNGNGSVVAYQGVDWEADKFSENKACDYLGNSFIWVDDETNTVSNNITSPAAVAHYNRMYKWWHEGLISKDASTTSEYSDTCLANGQYFCCFSNAEYGAGFAKSNNTGRDLCALPVCNIGLTTSYVNSYGFGLPMTCENPEAATAVMNLLFEDVDVANLLVWGIRGRDYEVDENGCAYRLEGHTYEALEYFQGNMFNALPPIQPEGASYRQSQLEDNLNGYMSPYFGLVIDNTEVANELTAVQVVFDKYYPTLGSGEVEATPELIAKFDKEMNDAGMDKIIAFYQAAIDEWNSK